MPPVEYDPDEWINIAVEMAKSSEFMDTPHAGALQAFLRSQTKLITSLPREAAKRAQELAMDATMKGTSKETLAEQIKGLGEITLARADLIARTEVSRTASGLVQIRAQSMGSPGYIWRTCLDAKVREAHRVLEGKFFQWHRPPNAGGGMRYHPGRGPNCRCHPEPVFERK